MFNILVIGPVSSGKTWFLNQVIEKFNSSILLPEDQGRNTNCIYKIYHSDNPVNISNKDLKKKNEKSSIMDEIEIEINMKIKDKFFQGAAFYDSPGFEEKDFIIDNLWQKKIDYNSYDLIIFLVTPEKINAVSANNLKEVIEKRVVNKNIWFILNRVEKVPERKKEVMTEFSIETAITDFKKLGVVFNDHFSYFTNYKDMFITEGFYEKLHTNIKITIFKKANVQITEITDLVEKLLYKSDNPKFFDQLKFISEKSSELHSLKDKWTYVKAFIYSIFTNVVIEYVKNTNDIDFISHDNGKIYSKYDWEYKKDGIEIKKKDNKVFYKSKLFELTF